MAVEIVEINIRRQGRAIMVEVLADKKKGGITIDECTVINKQLSQKIEEENFIEDDYWIEVSSPGLDRPLKTEKDFMRVIGKKVRFHLSDFLENKKEYEGVIREVAGRNVFIKTKVKPLTIPLDKIVKATQII